MGNVLEKVNMPEDLKSLNLKEKEELIKILSSGFFVN